ncbi:hypothetical protein Aocu_07470 [Acholeplasma oculi]|uniref:Uncharacterized protein n=2 Tax=Acholeplasma oculi TaxID=35623 RepID=A0A061AA91_9MOLU|nr:hypothetical protein Aocu_07470 [Acholeplasma oculi]
MKKQEAYMKSSLYDLKIVRGAKDASRIMDSTLTNDLEITQDRQLDEILENITKQNDQEN